MLRSTYGICHELLYKAMKAINWTLITVGTGLVLASVCYVLLATGYVRFNHPQPSEYPVMGIDVSHHQKAIDWQTVGQSELRFAFIKATEGGDFKDPRFAQNWREAKKAGIDVGGYHFFTFCRSGVEQAYNFMATVPDDPSSLPPVIDLEFGGNCKLNKTKQEVLAEIDILAQLLHRNYKKAPILYVTKEFYEAFLVGKMTQYPLWVRDIFGEPKLKGDRPWLFWQYANRGHLDGITTYVDLNVFGGSIDAYEALKKPQFKASRQ